MPGLLEDSSLSLRSRPSRFALAYELATDNVADLAALLLSASATDSVSVKSLSVERPSSRTSLRCRLLCAPLLMPRPYPVKDEEALRLFPFSMGPTKVRFSPKLRAMSSKP